MLSLVPYSRGSIEALVKAGTVDEPGSALRASPLYRTARFWASPDSKVACFPTPCLSSVKGKRSCRISTTP